MTWTDSTDTAQSWNAVADQQSEWDSGASLWDQADNVALSVWDVTADTSWTDSTNTGNSWS